ncbi:type IIS restriction enzyme protein [Helicobacter pylori Hp H-4]|uniref:restriction endonuclease subunit S n=1 Tax=Helicobacter pylori TaxID=210 RepID=UPI00026B13B7|nr:restriction endonuclease subunit S [Helicobacter pylori]EJB78463.1 type IIS restriction enzyme protein [Helicobacter pylori Hp H-4]
MIGPLGSQLNAIKWGEFKLGDLFEIYTGSLLSQEDLAKGDIVRISVKSDNNGVYGHFDTLKNKKARHFENFISVNFFGNCFYHPYLASVEMKVHVLKLKNRLLTRRVGLFLANQLNKCFYGQFTYGTQLSSSKLKHNNFKIQLPLKPTANAQTLEDIDFDFMEKFIAEFEQCRLAELEAYLKVTGLENTTLSNDEENALNVFNGNNSGGNTSCGLTWQHFKLGDLFEIRPTKAYNLTNPHLFDSNAKNPVVTNSSLNNGISGYSSLEPTEKGNQITYSDTTTSEGIFYQKRPFIGYSHVQGLYPLKYHEFWNEKTLLYIVVAFKKVACGRFDYGNKFNRKIASEMLISLPTNPHGGIDFHFMRTLINALMKQTIQGVVQYSSAKIQTAKEAISQETPTQKDSLF